MMDGPTPANTIRELENQINYLEVYDKQTRLLVAEYPLQGIDVSDLKKMLGIDENAEIYGYDLLPAQASNLTRHINGSFTTDTSYEYQVGFYRE
ncbi:DUF7683 domain-containing protein [Nocardia bovistercoris]|uniref:DUF7683 domain-containing protein n=1 Tax=Nocardia bovistercoris TaxID=2785916 RepID=A0A931IC01_9NOCA|nr:hypothetical protein [Nocardia bovistercoris]MBH0778842.1 hypothetical protein [Nocardia bovistercoris]